jgi:hypothetical protein
LNAAVLTDFEIIKDILETDVSALILYNYLTS